MVDITRTSGIEPATGAGADRQRPDHEERESPPPPEPGRRTPRDIQDVAQMMGIPAAEMTPSVCEALDIIVNEYDRVRLELEREHGRVTHFHDLADRHPRLPVANRRTFLRELARLINRAGQTQTVSSVALLHVRNLDSLRLDRGRAVADGILEQVALRLADNVRASDLVAAMGGADFAILLTLTDEVAAAEKTLELAEGVRCVLELERPGEAGTSLGVAWGFCSFTAEDEAERVVDAADDDLRRRQASPE